MQTFKFEKTEILAKYLGNVLYYLENNNIFLPAEFNEVKEWFNLFKTFEKQEEKDKTKELKQLAQSIWPCYESGETKYIDSSDLQRIVYLAKDIKSENIFE